MIAALYFENYLAPSLADLTQRRLAERGLEDGMAGKIPASEAQAYTGAWQRGALFRRAGAREIALTFGSSWRCPQCRAEYPGASGGLCACTPSGTPLEQGLEAMYGPGEPDDDCLFFGQEDLRRLAQAGVPVVTLDGDRLNEQILVQ